MANGVLSSILGAILPSIAGVVQSGIESKTQKRNVDMTIAANRQLAEYQYSKDLEMWNRANEYNTPAAQMARYTSAGLNPNLIYGTGSASAGNTATSLPKYQAPNVQYDYRPPIDVANVVGKWQDFQVKQAQIDNLKEQNRLIRLNADLKYYERGIWEPRGVEGTRFREDEIPIKYRLIESQIEALKAQVLERSMLMGRKAESMDLVNELKQKQVNWYVADKLAAMAAKAVGALGVSKLAGRLRPAPYQGAVIPSKRIRIY